MGEGRREQPSAIHSVGWSDSYARCEPHLRVAAVGRRLGRLGRRSRADRALSALGRPSAPLANLKYCWSQKPIYKTTFIQRHIPAIAYLFCTAAVGYKGLVVACLPTDSEALPNGSAAYLTVIVARTAFGVASAGAVSQQVRCWAIYGGAVVKTATQPSNSLPLGSILPKEHF